MGPRSPAIYFAMVKSKKYLWDIQSVLPLNFCPSNVGFAHGFLGLKKENILSYHCTNYRSKKHEVGIKWDDPDIKINWKIKKPFLSSKDKKNLSLKEYLKKYA